MTLSLFIFVAAYLGFSILLWLRTNSCRNRIDQTYRPSISIIVASRNEGNKIDACLASLVHLSYPKEKTEIIIVNDHSDDHSTQIIDRYVARYQHVKHIYLTKKQKTLPGKAGAVLVGIEKSKGEIIFLTDADCLVTPTWVTTLIDAFTPSVGMVGGFTILHQKNHRASFWHKSQALDWLYLLTVAATAAEMGKPLSWMGNNLAFRRTAYEQVGGYHTLGHSLIEDFVLIDAIARQTDWRITFLTHPKAIVYSQPVTGFKQLYNQRKRWGMGIRLVRPFGKLLMSCSFISHFLVFIHLVINPVYAVSAGTGLLFADFLLCLKSADRLGRRDLLLYFPGFELLYFCYAIFLPIILLFSQKVTWKNDVYGLKKAQQGSSFIPYDKQIIKSDE